MLPLLFDETFFFFPDQHMTSPEKLLLGLWLANSASSHQIKPYNFLTPQMLFPKISLICYTEKSFTSQTTWDSTPPQREREFTSSVLPPKNGVFTQNPGVASLLSLYLFSPCCNRQPYWGLTAFQHSHRWSDSNAHRGSSFCPPLPHREGKNPHNTYCTSLMKC